MERPKDRTLKDVLPRSVGAQYATREEQEIAPEGMKRLSQSRNNVQLWIYLVVKVRCCKEQYCIGTWDVRSMNQDKLEVIKQEIARLNIDILEINELKWTRMDKFNSDDHYIYHCGQEGLRRNGVALIVNKRVGNTVLGCNDKNNRMISVHFQSKPFNITAIQVYAPTPNAEEAAWFYEDLQELLELTPKKKKKDFLFIIEDWNAKVGSQKKLIVTGKFGLGV